MAVEFVTQGKKMSKKKRTQPKRKGTTIRQVKNIINKDRKVKEKRFAITGLLKTDVLGDSFYVAEVTSLAQGGTIDDRLQNKIRINYIHAQFTALNNTALRTKAVRVMIVQDWNSLGTLLDTANWTNLFRDSNFGDTAATALSADLTLPINLNLVKVHWDKVYLVKPEQEGALYVKKKIRINKIYEYGRNQGSSTFAIGGKMYLIIHMCNVDDVSTAATMRTTGMIRVFFKDE